MIGAGVKLQFFAAFISPKYRHCATVRALDLIDLYYREMEAAGDLIEPVLSYHDIARVMSSGKAAALLSLEGGEALAGRLSVLRLFYRLGVRSIGLTWNGRNELADGVGEGRTGGGLTEFGVRAVKEMDRLGILVDVSHLSEPGFWDVIEISGRPVIATHANSRSQCDHPRNLKDSQIKALAGTGGVIGLCFCPDFICNENPCLERLLDHAEYIASVAGIECIGLGSDFDGIEKVAPGLEDVTRIPYVAEGLRRRGFNGSEIEMIMGHNWLRVIKEVLQ
jgi:membrane dipeptidase